MAKINVRAMSVFDLIDLRGQVDAVLSQKVAAERKALQASLAKLEGVEGKRGKRAGTAPRHAMAGKKVEPKYRGPDGETWSGRGLKPKWLTAAIKDGKAIEDFLIVKAKKGRKAKA
jgi:DNA-binding protein H-NS